ncbi:Pentatricopeptide repeat [Parasponia andersonii]|uniref:Pentatricopeptide repeat n=1 Tax=Parasponia andersonii TaxID=3476 RepID=A0A2P5D4Q0_PARAD|nr:Pentatricopeptide repeat [Parasponia andersonii]
MSKRNLVSWNSMVDGYAKCGDVISALEMFQLMPEKDVVSWSSLTDGVWKGWGSHRSFGTMRTNAS